MKTTKKSTVDGWEDEVEERGEPRSFLPQEGKGREDSLAVGGAYRLPSGSSEPGPILQILALTAFTGRASFESLKLSVAPMWHFDELGGYDDSIFFGCSRVL